MPSTSLLTRSTCPCCGNAGIAETPILWPELIQVWELDPEEVALINRQQGRYCLACGARWRSMALARAILSAFQFEGLFTDFVNSEQARSLRVLEINTAGELTQFLRQLPQHRLVEFPEFDMQALTLDDHQYDVVLHSDTLEHVPDPLAGLQECCRILVPGGVCLYTIPVLPGRMTRNCRNRQASYHGGPHHPQDFRVQTEFGADFWTYPFQAGFESVNVEAWEFPAALAIAARKSWRITESQPAAESQVPELIKTAMSTPQSTLNPEQISPTELPATGERLLTSFTGKIVAEHLHRYGLALALCQGKDVLDVASGEGYGSALLARVARSVVGVDIDPAAVKFASAKYRSANLGFVVGDGTELPLPDASVDVVVSFETIEHLPDHERFLAGIRRVLRPDGCLIISSPDRETYRQEAGMNPYHVREVDRQELESSLRRCFQHVSFAAQRMCYGSLIVPDSGESSQNGFTTLDGNFHGIRQSAGLPQPTYWIAVASNSSPLPELPWGIFDSPMPVDDPVHEIAQLRKQINELEQSTSWKVTAPVRWLSNVVKSFKS